LLNERRAVRRDDPVEEALLGPVALIMERAARGSTILDEAE
jgi:hypothetical protein